MSKLTNKKLSLILIAIFSICTLLFYLSYRHTKKSKQVKDIEEILFENKCNKMWFDIFTSTDSSSKLPSLTTSETYLCYGRYMMLENFFGISQLVRPIFTNTINTYKLDLDFFKKELEPLPDKKFTKLMLKNLDKCLKNQKFDRVMVPEEIKILLLPTSNKTFSREIIYLVEGINLCSYTSGKDANVIELMDKIHKPFISSLVKHLTDFYTTQMKQNDMKSNMEYFDHVSSMLIPMVKTLKKNLQTGNIQLVSTDKDTNLYNFFDSIEEKFIKFRKEIFDYSYEYEEQKYKQMIKDRIVGNISDSVYDKYFQPKEGLFAYTSKSEYPLEVIQSVPGGVLLSGGRSSSIIFLETSANYADHQIISNDFVAEFSGYYEYTTVRNSHKKIYKFTELTYKKLIDDNSQGSDSGFYFLGTKIE